VNTAGSWKRLQNRRKVTGREDGPDALPLVAERLWNALDELRGSVDASHSKLIFLSLVFLRYLSETLAERQLTNPVFRVPPEARWPALQASSRQPDLARLIDSALQAVERANPSLRGVLPKECGSSRIDGSGLSQMVDLVSAIGLTEPVSRSESLRNAFGLALDWFADFEGRKADEPHTPASIARLLAEVVAPHRGRVFDPCCRCGELLAAAADFSLAHGGRKEDLQLYGQEGNGTNWRLARMNLAVHDFDADLGPSSAVSLNLDLHPDLKAESLLALPPFNVSGWRGDLVQEDRRWLYGTPPAGNANYAWIQHFLFHLAPHGFAAFVLTNASLSSSQRAEREIRKNIVEADLVDCIVTLPGQLLYSTNIPVCVWVLAKDKTSPGIRRRRQETLLIDARPMGDMIDRTRRALAPEEITRIAKTYHAWSGRSEEEPYQDLTGFCRAVRIEELREQGYLLTPGRYVGEEAGQEDAEPAAAEVRRLAALLRQQTGEAVTLEKEIWNALEELGLDG
jgi:type I restriction enzyme M protein